MRASRGLGLLLFALIATVGASSPARAWTRTVVSGARATVDVAPDATLHILLRLDVEVRAGWLHEIEMAGLGTGVELDRNRPPYLRSEEGEVLRPDAEVHDDGLIHLSFPRREAPRRGTYRVFMRYRTKTNVSAIEVEGKPRARIVWSVPAWETSLHNVLVEIRAPAGSSVPTDVHDTPAGVDFQVTQRPDHTIVQWRRIQLPRGTDWPLTLDVPAESIAMPIALPDAPEPVGFRPLTTPGERPIAWPLLVLGMLVLLKRRLVEVRLGRSRLLVQGPRALILAIAGALFAIGQWLAPNHLICAFALIALSLHRPARRKTTIAPRDWRSVPCKELPRARVRASDFLDGTTTTGLTLLVAGAVCLVALGQPMAALLLLPIFLTGTRYHMAPSVARSADALSRFAAELRLGADAPDMSFAWELSSDGVPRLRVHLCRARAGLMSLSFVVASSSRGFVWRPKIMLLVETRAQSEADDLARRRVRANADLRAPDGSILRLVQWDGKAMELLRVFARQAPKPTKASRGTWLLREISAPRRKAA